MPKTNPPAEAKHRDGLIWCQFAAFKMKILKFYFFRENSAFPFAVEKALVKIIFGRKILICQPIFEIFVALFTTFCMQKDSKITFCRRYFRTS